MLLISLFSRILKYGLELYKYQNSKKYINKRKGEVCMLGNSSSIPVLNII